MHTCTDYTLMTGVNMTFETVRYLQSWHHVTIVTINPQ